MFNLLKSDIFRVVRLPLFWTYLLVIIVMCVLEAGLIAYLASPEFSMAVNGAIDGAPDEGSSQPPVLNEKVLPSITYGWANFFMSSGILGIVMTVFIGIYLVRDIRGGFIKNLPMDKRSRRTYFAEKLVFIALLQAFTLALAIVGSTVAIAAFGITYEVEESAAFIALWIVLAWFVLCAYGFLVACVAWISRLEWLASLWGVLVSSGIAGMLVIQVSQMFAASVPVLAVLPYWTLRGSVVALESGEQAFYASAPSYPIPQIGVEGQIVLVAGIVIVAAVVFVMTVCCRRNIK